MNWIPVEERLPATSHDVLVWLGEGGYKSWDRAWYDEVSREWIDGRDEVCHPTHWAKITRP
jgi:hypothetical protein